MHIEPDLAAWAATIAYVTRDLTVDGSRDDVDRFRAALAEDYPWKRRDGFLTLCVDAFQGRAWAWPWLLEWKVRFAALDAVPRMWRVDERISHPNRGRLVVDRDVFLLSHAITHHRRRFDRRPTPDFIRFATPLGDEPPAITALEREHIRRYRTGEIATLPPWWPGQRLSISLLSGFAYRRSVERGKHDAELLSPYRGGQWPKATP